MTPSRFAAKRDSLRMHAEPRYRDSVQPLELFFDLVFVLGFAQCSALMAAEGSWTGLLRGCIALALLWWAWAAYAWLTNVIDPEEGSVRLVLFAAMASSTIVSTALPKIIGDLNGSQTQYTWVVTATLLTATATTPRSSRGSRPRRRRRCRSYSRRT